MPFARDKLHGFEIKDIRKGYALIRGQPFELVQRSNGDWLVRKIDDPSIVICKGYGKHNALYRLARLLDAQKAGESINDVQD
jgi:hypothetical protein